MRPANLLPLALAAASLAATPEPAPEPETKLLARDDAALLERGLAEDILEDIKNGLSCAGCEVWPWFLKPSLTREWASGD